MECLICKQKFEYPDFGCTKQPGNHVVAEKQYFHPGGKTVQSVRDRYFFGPHIVLVPGITRLDNATGNFQRIAAVEVDFVRGRFSTTNPEEQYYLDRKPGLCDEATWENIYLTAEQQVTIAKGKLEDIQRQIKEGNSLLDQVKAKQQPTGRTA